MGAIAIVGAQFGSEGKGVVAADLASYVDAAVRVGGPNAGHSFKVIQTTPDGMDIAGWRTYKMRGIPCAWVNEDADLYIGAGAVVDPHLLREELETPGLENVWITVDHNAAIVTKADQEAEAGADLWGKVGSTLEGVGEARIGKIRRDLERHPRAAQHPDWHSRVRITRPTFPVAHQLHAAWEAGATVMLEGTQGAGLSLDHTPVPPFSTSANATVSALLDQTGLPPAVIGEGGHVFLVARTLPIRVAGNSGPMHEELTWEDLREHAGVGVPERTTVTQRVRRIGRWDDALFGLAKRLNEPCGVFLMFADYLVPDMAGTRDAAALLDAARPGYLGDLKALTTRIEVQHRVPIVGYGTGGDPWAIAIRGRCAHGVAWDL